MNNFPAKFVFLLFGLFCYIPVNCQSNDTIGSSLQKNLIFYLPFTGNADDVGSNKLKATVKRATPCADRFGKENNAFHFNGSDTYIYYDSMNVLTTINAVTICAWIYPRNYTPVDYSAWISKPVGDRVSQFRIGFGRAPDSLWGLTINNNNRWNEYYAQNLIPLNTWSFVVYTANSATGEAAAYLNGVEVGRWKDIVKFPESKSPLYIGYQLDDRSIFDGTIDEVRIYDKVLTSEEIVSLYNIK